MKKRLLLTATVLALICVALAGCGGSAEAPKDDAKSDAVTYDSIIEDYTSQLETAGADAVEAYKAEASGITDVNALATIATEKVQGLAEVFVSGGQELADLQIKNGDDQAVYEENYQNLYQVYNDKAMDVYAAYMESYAEAIPGMTDDLKQQMLDQLQSGLEAIVPTK